MIRVLIVAAGLLVTVPALACYNDDYECQQIEILKEQRKQQYNECMMRFRDKYGFDAMGADQVCVKPKAYY